MSPPPFAYLVCATPRSGSTLLCETLRATGVAGHPLEHFEVLRHSTRPRQPREYFEEADIHEAVIGGLAALDPPRPDPESSERWWSRILREGATANGVWGGKLMWGHVDDLLARARGLDEVDADADLAEALRALLGDDIRLVHVTRPDKVAQGVSLWRAVQTQSWRAGQGESGTPAHYDFTAIDHLVRQLEDHDARWRAWFVGREPAPLEVSYDELAADARATVGRVLRALGLPEVDVPATATRRQGDQSSREWVERFRADRGRAA